MPGHRVGANRSRPSASFAAAAGVAATLLAGACIVPVPVRIPPPATASPIASPSASATPAETGRTGAPTVRPGPTGSVGVEPRVTERRRCPFSRFECVTLEVPRDHAAPGGETWEVAFAVAEASEEQLGTLVVLTGGPGSSGIYAADGFADSMPADIGDHYDLVFLDQRGAGSSEPFDCTDAVETYYRDPAWTPVTAGMDAALAAAERFVTACVAEASVDPESLAYYGTDSVAVDLELVRRTLGVEQLHLYGESYGTELAQVYAAMHPERVAALLLDSPVDLTRDGPAYAAEAIATADDALVATLEACNEEAPCRRDMPGSDAVAAWDKLAARLDEGPLPYPFPLATGSIEERRLTRADLESASAGFLMSPLDRWLLQRAIAAAARDNVVPVARLAYTGLGLDPDRLTLHSTPDWSDALYYAVTCHDYAFFPEAGDTAARAAAWTGAAEDAGIADARLGSLFYDALPCLFWPAQPATNVRPPPIEDPRFPTLVLASEIDPATPFENASRIFARLDEAWLVIADGAGHVLFGRGESCPDDLVRDFLVDGTEPDSRTTICPGALPSEYLPVAASTPSVYRDPVHLMLATDDQIFSTVDYMYWLEDEAYPMGCDHGGTLTYRPDWPLVEVELERCAFTPDMPLTGEGSIDEDTGEVLLDLEGPDFRLRYTRDEEALTVQGTFRGQEVDSRRDATSE